MRLLLHMCCAPCSVYPVEILSSQGIDIQGFFYNPNIHPMDEFMRRKEALEAFSKIKNIEVVYSDEFQQGAWEIFQGTSEERCNMCYNIRLDKAAKYAKDNGFDGFSTTLLISPYQKHDVIKSLGEQYSKKYGVQFFYTDFRVGFRQGQQAAKEMGLYRQKFCGCVKSQRT